MRRIVLSDNTKSETIAEAITVLSKGGIIIYPTETCYGVGIDGTNQDAVNKLLRYKERPEGKAISIAVSDSTMAEQYVEVNKTAQNLYSNFLPGPITVISKSKQNVAKGIEAEDGSLGIRIPDYPFTLELIKQFGKPITATSANMSGRNTPYSIEDILNNIPKKKKELIDLIIDAGELPHNPPSTVVDARMNDEIVLREGSIRFQNQNSSVKTITSQSEEETQNIGEKLMSGLIPQLTNKSVVFALQGELGAGKTQFAKGVARALGIKENVTSPTFTIVKEYIFNNSKLFHIDTWRMQEEKELSDLGFEEMLKPGNVIVVEWAEKVMQLVTALTKKNSGVYLPITIRGENEESHRIISWYANAL